MAPNDNYKHVNNHLIFTLFMVQEPTSISAHSFLTLSPLGTAVLEPDLEVDGRE